MMMIVTRDEGGINSISILMYAFARPRNLFIVCTNELIK